MAVTFGDGPNGPNLPEPLFDYTGYTFEKTDDCCGWPANYDVSSDGSRFVMVRHKNPVTPTVINIIFNWTSLLEENQ